jgi:phytoene dehydrogenase-like protein
MQSSISVMGKVGLPAPIHEIASKTWDVIVVGAGHNGLTCAAYLLKAGKRVLVLEARERIGGANTLEEAWPGVRMSPCAYLAGLIHPTVLDELGLVARGFHWTAADKGFFVPFEDGSSVLLADDDDECAREIRAIAPQDVAGWFEMKALLNRAILAVRPLDERDMWLGSPPSREQIEDRLGNDDLAQKLLFDWSMADYADHFLTDSRMRRVVLGQGIIGTNASPYDPGTAFINWHHSTGRMDGKLGSWGYLRGGMGMFSFMLCDLVRELGGVVAAGAPVAEILPGEGVRLAGGELIHAPIVVSNADPVATRRLLGDAADPVWTADVNRIPILGCTVKFNLLLRELPVYAYADADLFRAQHNTPLSREQWINGHAAAQRGELPEKLWMEMYFQTAHDRSVIMPDSPYVGCHTMSVFSQYVPYAFAHGNWDSRRDDVKRLFFDTVAPYISNFPDAVIDMQVLGPPDIEQRVGLTGGHIFQGECLPQYMWSNRLSAKTPMPGVYLCGACTHPGGSVIAVNGRNAAMHILGEK